MAIQPEKKMQPEKARQGKLGQPVLMVLVAALILLAVVWFGVEMFGQAIEPTDQNSSGTLEPAGEQASPPGNTSN